MAITPAAARPRPRRAGARPSARRATSASTANSRPQAMRSRTCGPNSHCVCASMTPSASPPSDGAGHRAQAPQHHGDQALGGGPHAEHRRDLVRRWRRSGSRRARRCAEASTNASISMRRTGTPTISAARRWSMTRAHAEAEARVVQRPVEQRRRGRRHDEHQQVLRPEQERADRRSARPATSAGKALRCRGSSRRRRLLDLHPHGEARDHGGDGRRLAERAEAEPLHVEPGQRRAGDRRSAPPAARRCRAAAKA